jgi:hypothetical protein
MSTPASRLATAITRRVFATEVAAEIWFKENDPEGVAFEYEVIGSPGVRSCVCL